MQLIDARSPRAAVHRIDHRPGLSYEEALLEDVRIAILSGNFVDDIVDEDLPVAGRLQLIAEPETPQ